MKTAGLIGGLGPESTLEYYRRIVARYRELQTDDSYPTMIINSVNLSRMLAIVRSNRLDVLADQLLFELEKLARAGAHFGLLTANTPHLVFDELQRRSPFPLISIVEATCAAAQTLNLKKVGLFGTQFTMQARFYPDVFSSAGIELFTPEAEEQDYIHDKYMNELIKGLFLPETHARLLEMVDRMQERHGIEGLILGGTELPLILRDQEQNGVKFLDTTKIHVERVVAEMLS